MHTKWKPSKAQTVPVDHACIHEWHRLQSMSSTAADIRDLPGVSWPPLLQLKWRAVNQRRHLGEFVMVLSRVKHTIDDFKLITVRTKRATPVSWSSLSLKIAWLHIAPGRLSKNVQLHKCYLLESLLQKLPTERGYHIL